MPKEHINPDSLFPSLQFGFSQIVTSQGGKTVYLSGQVAWNAEEKIVGANLQEQMRQSLKNIQTALETVGGTLDDVVHLRIYVVNYKPETDAVAIANGLKEFFTSDRPPATTWLGISSLADKDFLIEIEATAVLE